MMKIHVRRDARASGCGVTKGWIHLKRSSQRLRHLQKLWYGVIRGKFRPLQRPPDSCRSTLQSSTRHREHAFWRAQPVLPRSSHSSVRGKPMTFGEKSRAPQVGVVCAWLSVLATVEQLVEFGVPWTRAAMMPAYPTKAVIQFLIAIAFGVLGGFLKRPRLYWLIVIPLIFLASWAIMFLKGEA